MQASHDFQRMVPLGGCALPCGFVLASCGHACMLQCHGQSTKHLCLMPCPFWVPECGHACMTVGCQHEADHQCMRRCTDGQ